MPLRLTEVQRPLGLFAEALAGRVLHLDALDGERGGWPWELDLPRPDVVELPTVARPDGSDADQRRMYRMQVLHQVAMAELGTFGDDPEVPDRFAAPHHPAVVASPHPALAAGLVVMLEHHRVAAATRHRYPGARADLDRALGLAREWRLRVGRSPDRAGPVTALQLRCRGAGADELRRQCPRVDPALITWLVRVTAPLTGPAARLDDSARVAAAIAARLGPAAAGPDPDDGPDAGSDPRPEGRPSEEPAEPTRDEADGDGIPAAGPPPEGDVDAERGDLSGDRDAGALSIAEELEAPEEIERLARPDRRPDPAPTTGDERTFLYDEWDHGQGRYRPAWCRLVERRIEGTDHDFIAGVRRRHAQLSRQIRSQFIRLRPEDRIRVHRQVDGDELDLDAMIEAIVDHRSGTLADDRVTIRRDRATRDVATALLVDLSASTSSPIEPPEPELDPGDPADDGYDYLLDPGAAPVGPPPRRIIDVAKDAVALMCDALQQLGDRHAVYGFSGQGRLDVEFHVSKDFDDPTSPSTWAALGALAPIRYTRMGPAIRHTAAKLAALEARTKLLIVISDGYPQDVDYGPDRTDRTYGVEDTARAVADAARAGVDAFCVTIDPAGTDYLGAMFPEHRYLVIEDVESLPSELSKLYLRLSPTGLG
ncbi:MAG: nitric oxide reductase activation protein NorD [Acidimicrobiales bacterium]